MKWVDNYIEKVTVTDKRTQFAKEIPTFRFKQPLLFENWILLGQIDKMLTIR